MCNSIEYHVWFESRICRLITPYHYKLVQLVQTVARAGYYMAASVWSVAPKNLQLIIIYSHVEFLSSVKHKGRYFEVCWEPNNAQSIFGQTIPLMTKVKGILTKSNGLNFLLFYKLQGKI